VSGEIPATRKKRCAYSKAVELGVNFIDTADSYGPFVADHLIKHWPNRTAIAAEAFGQQMAEAIPLPDTDTGSAVGDFTEQVRLVSLFYASHAGTIFAQLLADSVFNPESGAFFLTGRREAIRELWERALARGEVKASIDVETATDILFGPLIFRLLSGHAPLNDQEAERIAFAALNGLMK
jgi:hypothetical protein